MPPTDQRTKSKGKFSEGKGKQWNNRPTGGNKKRKWVPEHKSVFDGSVGEGQGFAFKRKQKVQHEYNKLLRKERIKNQNPKALSYKNEYPEHLRHLYLAEAEKLRDEARQNRVKRSQGRRGEEDDYDDDDDDDAVDAGAADAGAGAADDAAAGAAAAPAPEAVAGGTEQSDTTSLTPESTEAKGPDSLPVSNRMKKKMARKTSYQKTKEEFEKIKEKKRQKKQEFLTSKQQREEAILKYTQKKTETFQMLNKKTKKGQPNLNLQMEYLLQKIQGSGN